MFRDMAVDSSVLLLSCSITTGASGSPSLLLSMLYNNNNNVIAHNLTLIITPKSFNSKPPLN